MITILTEDGIIGMLIVFLIIYLFCQYMPKIYLKNIVKKLPISDDAEVKYRKIRDRYNETLKIKRSQSYISLVSLLFLWVHIVPILKENDILEDCMIYIQIITFFLGVMFIKVTKNILLYIKGMCYQIL